MFSVHFIGFQLVSFSYNHFSPLRISPRWGSQPSRRCQHLAKVSQSLDKIEIVPLGSASVMYVYQWASEAEFFVCQVSRQNVVRYAEEATEVFGQCTLPIHDGFDEFISGLV